MWDVRGRSEGLTSSVSGRRRGSRHGRAWTGWRQTQMQQPRSSSVYPRRFALLCVSKTASGMRGMLTWMVGEQCAEARTSQPPSVLVPGSGLSRLAYMLMKEGETCPTLDFLEHRATASYPARRNEGQEVGRADLGRGCVQGMRWSAMSSRQPSRLSQTTSSSLSPALSIVLAVSVRPAPSIAGHAGLVRRHVMRARTALTWECVRASECRTRHNAFPLAHVVGENYGLSNQYLQVEVS